MRGAFVHTYDAFYGPMSPFGAPNTQYIFAQPCRYVEQQKILQVQFPFSLAHAWMTHNAPALDGPDVIAPWVPAEFADYRTADQIVVSAKPGKRYVYCRSEFVNPVVRPSYYRGLLIDVADLVTPPWLPPSPLPPPPPPPPGCAVMGNACLTAGTNTLGSICPYSIGAGVSTWIRFPCAPATLYSRVVNQLTGNCTYTWWHGPNCAGLIFVSLNAGSHVAPYFNGPPGDTLWCNIAGIAPTSTFNIRVF